MREYLKEVGEQSEEPKQPEEATEEISGEPREISEQPEEQSDEWRRFSEQMFAWMEEEDQELRNFIEEVQRTERLDIEGIRGLVRTEYTEPMILRADEARKEYVQRHEEEIAAVAEYNGKLASFEPRMDDQFILDNISGMTENYALLQDNLLENSRAYGEYAKYSTDSVREYADELQKRAKEAQMKSDETIAEGLSEAQRIKKESSFANQKILADFASKLPYTRIGKAEYTQVYQFVADPVEAEDCSEGKKQDKGLSETVNVMENQKHERNKDQEVSEISDKKKTKKPVAYAVFGGFIVILSVQIYFFIRRRKKEYEY